MRNAKVDVMQLFRLWQSGVETQVICDTLGISRYRLFKYAEKYGLPRRPRNEPGVNMPRVDDPSPEQIQERCMAVQATWTDAEREKRLVGFRRARVELSRFCYRPTDCTYRPLN